MRRLTSAAIALAAFAVVVGPAMAAHRPGALLWARSDIEGRIDALAAEPADRLVAAGTARVQSPANTWVQARRADGSLDESFNSAGVVSFTGDPRLVRATAVQPDGRILLAESGSEYTGAGQLVRRLMPDGQPDPSFGGDGVIEPDLGDAASHLDDFELQPDGRLLVAGGDGGDGVVVRRYLADGSPDTGFGTLGVTRIRAGEDSGALLALRPNGDIVVSVERQGTHLGLALLTPSGYPNRSFGNGGEIAPVEYGRPAWRERVRTAYDPVVLPDGRLRLAAAYTSADESHTRMAVVGLTASGHPDSAFGRQGLARGPRPVLPRDVDHGAGEIFGEASHRALLDPRGSILVAGDLYVGEAENFGVAAAVVRRFRDDGSLDRSFGQNGATRLEILDFGYSAIVTAIALLGDDRLAIAHTTWNVKYQSPFNVRLRMLGANYDDEPPAITAVAGCRRVAIRVRDLSALDAVVVRAGHRVVRRSSAKRLRFRTPRRVRRLTVSATDLARNSSRVGVRVPRC